MFISAGFILLLLAFAAASIAAIGATSLGVNKFAGANSGDESHGPLALVCLVCGIWTLVVLGLAVAIPLGIVGYEVLESTTRGGFGGGGD